MKKLFIVGCPRSGTTMLQQALNRHPGIIIPPETKYFSHFLGHTHMGQRQHLRSIKADLRIELPPPPHRIATDHEAARFFDRIAQACLQRYGHEDIEYFGDKSPWHLLTLDRIVRVYPDARIILIYRDGRNVALSLSKVPWNPSDVYIGFAIWMRFYKHHRRALQRRDLKLLDVRYKDLVLDPENELRRIAEFLEVDYVPEMAEGQGTLDGFAAREQAWKAGALDKINASRLDVWRRELTPTQLERIERWGRSALSELGYELATDCSRRLPPWFFPHLWMRHSAWRLRCGWHLAAKELFAR